MPRRTPDPEGSEPHEVVTDDGLRLSGYRFPAGPSATPGLRVVLAHGFTLHSRRPPLVRIARRLSAYAEVVAADFRGHGRSPGASSAGGDDERTDVRALVADARTDGIRTVAAVGFSMGASTVLRQAAEPTGTPDLVVAVSPVSRWYVRDSTAMRRVHWLLESRVGHPVGRHLLGTRLGPPWAVVPTPPIDLVDRIPPRPLLLVHGTADRYFGPDHSVALQRAAGPGGAELWVEQGMGHAESAVAPALVDRIGRWLVAAAARTDIPSGLQTGVDAGVEAERVDA